MSAALSSRLDKKSRRTKFQIECLEQQIYEVLAEDHPQSVRHVFYRMTNPRLAEPVEKSDQGYAQVQNRITLMRRTGALPYSWITDATRRGYFVNTYTDRADFVRRVAGMYRANLWRDCDHYVEVWCESRSIAGVIQADCEDLAVSLYPAGGFSSISLAWQAAGYIAEETYYGRKPAHIVYIGDYDPAGVLIDKSIEKELRAHLDPRVDLIFHRIAITQSQILDYDLPTKPRKASDKRSLHVTETVEAEAMPAAMLRGFLRQTIERFLPSDALRVAKAAEESEKSFLLQWAEMMDEGEDY